MHPPAVSVDDLSVHYGDVVAVDGLSFTAERGEVVALLGPNGAGKTSTVEVLEGYRRPAAGRVQVLGLDPVSDHEAVVARIGVMLQDGGVYPGIRAAEVVRLFAAYYPDPLDPVELLERVGLAGRAGRTWRQLSGGEQQRLSLALALVGRPEVVFLDEPTAGIDVGGRQVVRHLVAELKAQGVCVLVTTHELDEAERMADRVLIIDRGRLIAAGTVEELRAGGTAADEIRFGTAPGIDVAALAARLGAEVVESSAGEYVARVAPTPANVATITGWLAEQDLALGDLRAGRQRLEDVFLRLTAGPHDPGARP